MRYLIILITTFLFGMEVEFQNTYQKMVFPNKKAILITPIIPINYSPKIYTNDGVLLLDFDNADEFVRNDLYLPSNGNTKNVKIALIDIDKIRYNIIQKLKNEYKKCDIKKIIFDKTSYKKVYFKPTLLNIKYKVILDC